MNGIICNIILNSDCSGSFYTGNIVTGNVILELYQEQKVERIDFETVGVSKARWTRPMPTVPYIKNYSEKITVFNIKFEDIFGEVTNGKIIQSGVHRYPFHFFLPEELPSTFDGSLGKVFYKIKVKSKPRSKIQKKVSFNVLRTVNINHIGELLKPSLYEFQKTVSCNVKKFEVSVRTFGAFSSKQNVPFEIIINNENNILISELNVILLQKVRYTVSSGYADKELKLHKIKCEKFTRSIVEVCQLNMILPILTPTTLNLTEPMIDISYIFRMVLHCFPREVFSCSKCKRLKIEIIFPFHFTQHEDIPVIIATVPVVHCDF